MNDFFLTLDLEECFHLEYLKRLYANGELKSKQSYADNVIEFFYSIAERGIKATVFVVGDIADKKKQVIKQIYDMGHEIGCHSYSHNLVNRMNIDDFRKETALAKDIIEQIIGEKIDGYRAPCFSMDNEKLELLWELGFKYDSSMICLKQHEYYNVLNMSKYRKIESSIYYKDGHYEFEIPTYNVFGIALPISGGGYFRLFPLWLNKCFYNAYSKTEDNFTMYIHPFEVDGSDFEEYSKLSLKDKFRFQVGRRNNINKLSKYIEFISGKSKSFRTISSFINDYENKEDFLLYKSQ